MSIRSDDEKRGSTTTLVIAVLSTVVAIALAAGLFLGVYGPLVRASGQPGGGSTKTSQGKPLVIGIARTPGGPGAWSAYAQVFARLQRELGRPIQIRYSLDRVSIAPLLKSGEVDLAMVTTNTYVDLADSGVATLVAAPIIDGEKLSAYVLVVPSGSSVTSSGDFHGARLLLPATSKAMRGFALSLFGGESGLRRHFEDIVIQGTQETILQELVEGRADAAFVSRADLVQWSPGTFRILAASREFGTAPIVAADDVDTATVSSIREVLLSPSGRVTLRGHEILGGFYVPRADQYDPVRAYARFATGSSLSTPVPTR